MWHWTLFVPVKVMELLEIKADFLSPDHLNLWEPNMLYKLNDILANCNQRWESNQWLIGCNAPDIDPLCTRRPLQVLWIRSVRSPGEVKHTLLPQSESPRTTGITCRGWDNWLWFLAKSTFYPVLPTCCWYILWKCCQVFFFIHIS